MGITVKKTSDASFHKYGRVLTGYDLGELIQKMGDTPLPDDVIYVASDKNLEALSIARDFTNGLFGGLPMQIGYCNGHNSKLNAVEYHRSSEFVVAVTDIILLIGMQQDVEEDYTYDTAKIEGFLIPAGTLVECYATTLHYAPCGVDGKGFRSVVVLPKDTNLDLVVKPEGTKEDSLLAARNKWLIAHSEANIDGAFNGLKGENVSV